MHWLDHVQNLRRFTPSRALGLRALVGAGLLAGAGMLLSNVASAEEDPVPCPFDNVLCLFEEEGYGGEIFNVRALNPQVGTCVNLPEHGWEGRAHSAYNTNSAGAAMCCEPAASVRSQPLPRSIITTANSGRLRLSIGRVTLCWP